MVAVDADDLSATVDAVETGLEVAVAFDFTGPDGGGEVDILLVGDLVELGSIDLYP